MKLRYLFLVPILTTFIVISCDIARPKKSFRLAVGDNDYFYNRMASHLEPFLERNGYEIDIVKASTAIEANQMVARGEADLTFINNHSHLISKKVGKETGKLRTLMPIAKRLFFAFSKNQLPDTVTA